LRPTKTYFDILRAYKDGARVIAVKGTARGSKTRSIVQASDFIADNSSRHRKITIASQSFPHLRDGAIYEYKKHQSENKIRRKHNKTEHEFELNKSIINYFSLDDPAKAIGPDRDILYINEINKGVTKEIYNHLKIRTKETVIFDWNPSGEFFIHDDGILEDDGTVVIFATWLNNLRNLTAAQIQDFIDAKKKSKTSDFWNYWWKVYGMGEDAVLMEERVMPTIRKVKAVPKNAIQIPSALDFGFFPDPTSFNELYIVPREVCGGLCDQLYIKPIVYSTKLSINSKTGENLTDMLLVKGVNKKHMVIAECADPRAIREMNEAGFNVTAVVKSSVETSVRLFHDYEIFIVDSKIGEVYKEFDNSKYARNAKGVIQAVPAKGQADHAIDGTRYVLTHRNSRWSIK
jgi:phage terminase large subunit